MQHATVDQLFAPRTAAEFLAGPWGRHFEYVPGWPGKFEQLLPWAVLNRLLWEHSFQPDRIRLVRNGETVSRAAYVAEQPFAQIKTTALTRHLRDGATLIINRIDTMHRPLGRFADGVARLFDESVGVNLYAGWGTEKGFRLHWDEYDVLVLQVFGRKRWQIYGDSRPYPVTHALEAPFEPPSEPVWEGAISAGDLLYIPRGWWHVAQPLDEPSLHLTFGVYRKIGRDLLLWLADQACGDSESARMDLPRRASLEERRQYLDALKAGLLAQWSPDLLDRFFASLERGKRGRPGLGLPWTATEEPLPPDDDALVQIAAGLTSRLLLEPVPDDGERLQLVAGGRRWKVTAAARCVVEPLLDGAPASLAQLIDRGRTNGIEPDAVRGLVASLVQSGLLELVQPEARHGTPTASGFMAHV